MIRKICEITFRSAGKTIYMAVGDAFEMGGKKPHNREAKFTKKTEAMVIDPVESS